MSIFVAKNFRRSEFRCPCGCEKDRPLDPKLLYLLQSLRDKIGLPIYISRGGGLRCKAYNKRIGGHIRSPHVPFYIMSKGKKILRGCSAADIHVKNMDYTVLAMLAKDIGFTRVGLYKSFVHIDIIRPYKNSSWVRDKNKKYHYFKTLEDSILFAKDIGL